MAVLSADSALLKLYLFYAALLVIKVSLMAFLTSRQKRRKKVSGATRDVVRRWRC